MSHRIVPRPARARRGALPEWRRHRRIAVAALTVAAFAAPGGSAQGATWAKYGVPGGDNAVYAVAARADAGGGGTAWVGAASQLQFSTIGSAGGWSAPQQLTASGAGTPQLGVANGGRYAAAWQQWDGSDYRISGATRTAAGKWSAPTYLSPAGIDAEQPQLVVGRGGTVDVAWLQEAGPTLGEAVLVTASTKATDAAPVWKTGAQLGGPVGIAKSFTLAIGSGGNDAVRIAWNAGDRLHPTMYTASHAAGAAWGAPTGLGEGYFYGAPLVSVGAKGEQTVVWTSTYGGGTNPKLLISRRTPGTAWSKPALLPASSPTADERASRSPNTVITKPDGTTAIFSDDVETFTEDDLSPSGTWTTKTLWQDARPHFLSAEGAVADDAGGTFAFVGATASDFSTSWSRIFDARTGSGFSAGNLSGRPAVDAAGNGNVLVVWQSSRGPSVTYLRR